MNPTTQTHIATDPGVCGGKPHIVGSRIRVVDIYAWHERQGLSPDEIVSAYPSLKLSDVHAALAYYWDHREQIEAQAQADREWVSDQRSRMPSKLLRRLSGAADADQISS